MKDYTMTRKAILFITSVIATLPDEHKQACALIFADALTSDNIRFDRVRFFERIRYYEIPR